MPTIVLTHQKHGDVIVDLEQYQSDGKDGHGWSKKECEARGFMPKSEKKDGKKQDKKNGDK